MTTQQGRRQPPAVPSLTSKDPYEIGRLLIVLWRYVVNAFTGLPMEHSFTHLSGGSDPLSIDHKLLSATHTDTVPDAAVLGYTIYANATPAWTKLTGNVTSTKMFYTQTGTGVVSAAPIWATIAGSDIPWNTSDNIIANQVFGS